MSFSTEDLQLLRVIVDTGSFSKAAHLLNRVPSAVSYSVKRIEDDLGIELFSRHSRQAEPTPACMTLLQNSEWILRAMNELKQQAVLTAKGVESEFTIAINNILNPAPLGALMAWAEKAYPLTRFTIRTEVYNGCWDALYQRRAQVVIGAPRQAPMPEGIRQALMGDIAWDFVLSPKHPLARAIEPLTIDMMRSYPSIAVLDSAQSLQRKTSWSLTGQKVTYVSDLEMALNFIEHQVGVGYLPRGFVASAVKAGDVIVKRTEEEKEPVPVYLAWRTEHESPLLKAICEQIQSEAFKEKWLAPKDKFYS